MSETPEHNPYSAPSHNAWQAPSVGSMAAVLLGASIGMGVHTLIAGPLYWLWSWMLNFDGVPSEKLYYAVAQSRPFLSFSHAMGALSMITGGYWCARLSSESHMLRAFFSGLLIVVLIIFQLTTPFDLPVPDWSILASLIIPIPGNLFGAFWQRRRAGAVARQAVGMANSR